MKLALIGCGVRGEALAAAAQALGHTIVACSDTSTAEARRLAARCRAKPGRPRDAVAASDAVLFSSPSPEDHRAALLALEAGSPVYWGAPLTDAPDHARRMLDAAKSSGTVLTPCYANRACPQFGAAAAQTASGNIGNLGFIRVVRHAPTGPALHALAGDLDWIGANFGLIDTVFAQVSRTKSVDTAMVTLTLGKGPIAQCIASVAPGNAHAAIELCGGSGMIQFSTTDGVLRMSSRSAKSGAAGDSSNPLDPPIEVRRLCPFFEAIDAGRLSALQIKHEMHVVQVIAAAIDSARNGRAVKVRK